MFGNMEEMKEKMNKKLLSIIVEAEAGDGAVKVSANATREILNISFDKSLLNWDDQEEVEDLLTIAVNRALAKAAEQEAIGMQEMMKEIMPPGMGDFSDLLG